MSLRLSLLFLSAIAAASLFGQENPLRAGAFSTSPATLTPDQPRRHVVVAVARKSIYDSTPPTAEEIWQSDRVHLKMADRARRFEKLRPILRSLLPFDPANLLDPRWRSRYEALLQASPLMQRHVRTGLEMSGVYVGDIVELTSGRIAVTDDTIIIANEIRMPPGDVILKGRHPLYIYSLKPSADRVLRTITIDTSGTPDESGGQAGAVRVATMESGHRGASGRAGLDGAAGLPGADGAEGGDGTCVNRDGEMGAWGQDGGNGEQGGAGQPGSDGEAGTSVTLVISDPNDTQIRVVRANGGDGGEGGAGGNGGLGGNGGRGGKGGDGALCPNCVVGKGGYGGNGGGGGNGGDGGIGGTGGRGGDGADIFLTYPEGYDESRITADASGGAGGNAGAGGRGGQPGYPGAGGNGGDGGSSYTCSAPDGTPGAAGSHGSFGSPGSYGLQGAPGKAGTIHRTVTDEELSGGGGGYSGPDQQTEGGCTDWYWVYLESTDGGASWSVTGYAYAGCW